MADHLSAQFFALFRRIYSWSNCQILVAGQFFLLTALSCENACEVAPSPSERERQSIVGNWLRIHEYSDDEKTNALLPGNQIVTVVLPETIEVTCTKGLNDPGIIGLSGQGTSSFVKQPDGRIELLAGGGAYLLFFSNRLLDLQVQDPVSGEWRSVAKYKQER